MESSEIAHPANSGSLSPIKWITPYDPLGIQNSPFICALPDPETILINLPILLLVHVKLLFGSNWKKDVEYEVLIFKVSDGYNKRDEAFERFLHENIIEEMLEKDL